MSRRIRSSLIASFVIGLIAAVAAPLAGAAPTDIDHSFGNNGIVRDRFGEKDRGTGDQVLIQPDGKILMAGGGYAGSTPGIDQLVARYNPDGSRDTTFGLGGFVLTNYAVDDSIQDIALMPDGRIVTVGSAAVGDLTNQDSTITRYLANGSLDPSFGTGGKMRIDALARTKTDSADRVAIATDGKLLVAGSALVGSDNDLWAQRFNVDGSPDSSFSGGHAISKNITDGANSSNDYVAGLVLHSDGTFVLLARYSSSSSDSSKLNAILLGYSANGNLDSSFGTAGKRPLAGGDTTGEPADLIEQPDGKLVVLFRDRTLGTTIRLARWNPGAASPDTAFGTGGFLTFTRSGEYNIRPEAFTRLGDGSFLIAGTYNNGDGADLFFAKATAGGAQDSSFGSAGVALYNSGASNESLFDLAVQPDGKFVGVGEADDFSTPPRSAQLIRLIGNYSPGTPVALSAIIKSPSKSKMKASKLKKISGTAVGTGLTKVRLAIQKLDPKLLKKSKRCLYVTSSKGKTKKYKPTKKKCAPTKFLTAKGTASWSYRIKLKPGKYKLTVQALGAGGVIGKSSTKSFKLTK